MNKRCILLLAIVALTAAVPSSGTSFDPCYPPEEVSDCPQKDVQTQTASGWTGAFTTVNAGSGSSMGGGGSPEVGASRESMIATGGGVSTAVGGSPTAVAAASASSAITTGSAHGGSSMSDGGLPEAGASHTSAISTRGDGRGSAMGSGCLPAAAASRTSAIATGNVTCCIGLPSGLKCPSGISGDGALERDQIPSQFLTMEPEGVFYLDSEKGDCSSLPVSNQELELCTTIPNCITSCRPPAAPSKVLLLLGNMSSAPSCVIPHLNTSCQFSFSQVGASRATTLIPERAHPSKGPDVEEWRLCKGTWPGSASGASGSLTGAGRVNSALWVARLSIQQPQWCLAPAHHLNQRHSVIHLVQPKEEVQHQADLPWRRPLFTPRGGSPAQTAPVGPSLLEISPGPSPQAAVCAEWWRKYPRANPASKTQLGTMEATRTAPSPSQGLAQ